jgi:hypothetical protein
MKSADLLSSARENRERLNDVEATLEAVVLRRYMNGRTVHVRIDDQSQNEIDLTESSHVLLVVEMKLADFLRATSKSESAKA